MPKYISISFKLSKQSPEHVSLKCPMLLAEWNLQLLKINYLSAPCLIWLRVLVCRLSLDMCMIKLHRSAFFFYQKAAGYFLRNSQRNPRQVRSRGGHESGLPESTPEGFCVLLSQPDPDPETLFCEKPDPDPESIFNFDSSRRLRGRFLIKNMGKFRLDRC